MHCNPIYKTWTPVFVKTNCVRKNIGITILLRMFTSVGLLVFSGCSVDETASEVAAANMPASESYAIRLIRTDLGILRPSTFVERDLVVTNSTAQNWFLDTTQSDCGCAVVDFSPDILRPSQEGTLRVRYHVPSSPGQILRTIRVMFKEDVPPVVFELTGRVESLIESFPPSITFDSVTPGNEESHHVRLRLANETDPQKLVVRVEHPWLRVKLNTDNIADAVNSKVDTLLVRLTCKFPLEIHDRIYSQSIIVADGESNEELVRIPVRVIIKKSFIVTPESLFFGSIPVSETAERTLTIQMRDDSTPLSGLTLSHNLGRLFVCHPVTPADDTQMQIQCKLDTSQWSPGMGSLIHGEIVIETPSARIMSVGVHAIVLNDKK